MDALHSIKIIICFCAGWVFMLDTTIEITNTVLAGILCICTVMILSDVKQTTGA